MKKIPEHYSTIESDVYGQKTKYLASQDFPIQTKLRHFHLFHVQKWIIFPTFRSRILAWCLIFSTPTSLVSSLTKFY